MKHERHILTSPLKSPEIFPKMTGWELIRLDGESTPEESKEIERLFSACLGLLNAGYSLQKAAALILAGPDLLETLEYIKGNIGVVLGGNVISNDVRDFLEAMNAKARAAITLTTVKGSHYA